MLDICGIDENCMAKVFESYECVGNLTKEAAQRMGLTENVKVIAGAGDNAAAAVGTGTVGDGKCNISLGQVAQYLFQVINSALMIIMPFIHLTMQTDIFILWAVCSVQLHVINGGWMKL